MPIIARSKDQEGLRATNRSKVTLKGIPARKKASAKDTQVLLRRTADMTIGPAQGSSDDTHMPRPNTRVHRSQSADQGPLIFFLLARQVRLSFHLHGDRFSIGNKCRPVDLSAAMMARALSIAERMSRPGSQYCPNENLKLSVM